VDHQYIPRIVGVCRSVPQINETLKWSVKLKILDHISLFESINFDCKINTEGLM